jgi:hypothetical protein
VFHLERSGLFGRHLQAKDSEIWGTAGHACHFGHVCPPAIDSPGIHRISRVEIQEFTVGMGKGKAWR